MDIQFILVIIIFIAALYYVGSIIYRAVSPKKEGCGTGCAKCAANFENIPIAKNND
ncbi:FeoB-associated Cys-rich membrane protein [Pedobacter insulae]|uniref:Virus attachment protein p12 family protein n=1 Tax=Pedobacter insulae TaxID=414048 RepID=A0A1I2T3F9_9SPHI|nr:FeoB-associated Cys-rich membrane protein [Pedobacter insulae]SFG59635.1 hypothetical protein SAMN04489864_101195 [Pedobacter insulae]